MPLLAFDSEKAELQSRRDLGIRWLTLQMATVAGTRPSRSPTRVQASSYVDRLLLPSPVLELVLLGDASVAGGSPTNRTVLLAPTWFYFN